MKNQFIHIFLLFLCILYLNVYNLNKIFKFLFMIIRKNVNYIKFFLELMFTFFLTKNFAIPNFKNTFIIFY
jgi:hypothetical protein